MDVSLMIPAAVVAEVSRLLTLALFVSFAGNAIIEALAAPVKVKWPELDLWWLIYVSWFVCGALVWASGINFFSPLLPDMNPDQARILSAIVAGRGSNMVADVFKLLKPVSK